MMKVVEGYWLSNAAISISGNRQIMMIMYSEIMKEGEGDGK